jgi:HK97 family phage prohead protease
MTVRTREFAVRVKAVGTADDLQEGQFIALVSVFGNEDSYGEIVLQGAFTQTLQDWAAKGDPIPVLWSHQWSDPFAHIGTVVSAEETTDGLLVKGQIDDLNGDNPNPTAQQVYRLLKGRRVTQFSFAYDVVSEAWVRDENSRWGGYWELRELALHEVGPCLVGVNQETELIAAKATALARGQKAGRVLSQSNFDTLTTAYEAIGEVLAAATPEADAEKGQRGRRPGQPGTPAAAGTTPAAQPAAEPATTPKGVPLPNLQDLTDEGLQEIADRVAKALEGRPRNDSKTDPAAGTETTPTPREAPKGAAGADADSARLRTALQLLELETTLTE